jgi:hypothetical protein
MSYKTFKTSEFVCPGELYDSLSDAEQLKGIFHSPEYLFISSGIYYIKVSFVSFFSLVSTVEDV